MLRLSKFFLNKKRFKLEYLFLITLFIFALFTTLYNLEIRSPFSWDQARDADVIWKMLVEGKLTLIGPQVVSDNAFFLGPLWYYLLAPFYFVFNLDPIAGPVAAVFSSILKIFALYFFVKKIAGKRSAAIASIILAGNPSVLAWNPMLVPFFSIGILYCLFKFLENKKNYLIYAFLLIGLSLQIHFQMIFFILALIFAVVIFIRQSKKVPLKELSLGLLIFVITFAPLILFDLRHEFINSAGVLKMFLGEKSSTEYNFNYLAQLNITIPKFIKSYFFLPEFPFSKTFAGIIILVMSIIGVLKLKIRKASKVLLLTLAFLPIFLFSFYKGRLSEYYFALCELPILIGFANSLKIIFQTSRLFKAAVIFFLIGVTVLNLKTILTTQNDTGMFYQRQAINYLKNQQEDKLINISFDVPYNQDAGLKYFFKYSNLNPQNIPEAHLWTISMPADKEPDKVKAIFGNIGIIRR